MIEAGYQAEPDRRTDCVEKQRRLKGKQSSADSDGVPQNAQPTKACATTTVVLWNVPRFAISPQPR